MPSRDVTNIFNNNRGLLHSYKCLQMPCLTSLPQACSVRRTQLMRLQSSVPNLTLLKMICRQWADSKCKTYNCSNLLNCNTVAFCTVLAVSLLAVAQILLSQC